MKTGGGISNLEMTSEQEVLLATLREQVEPLVNPYDSAADYFSNTHVKFEREPNFIFYVLIDDYRDDFKNFEMPVSELVTPETSTHPSELECPGPSALPPEAICVATPVSRSKSVLRLCNGKRS
ncbi:hypothetical protein TcasGA2_TC004998 [Tribolium castaneum]|uniref:Uncharacterized protein n=1 Tax=Tribolium castaneum TaxID=7070 RepID=D6WBY6_TRICA|nr:hypothetical protein TcasGA2_TC004998 [Tribolium castaneum]